jgi:WD40 repeat protein
VGHQDAVSSVEFYDQMLLVSASLDSTVRVWNYHTRKKVLRILNFIEISIADGDLDECV